jgi:hypothetical protein
LKIYWGPRPRMWLRKLFQAWSHLKEVSVYSPKSKSSVNRTISLRLQTVSELILDMKEDNHRTTLLLSSPETNWVNNHPVTSRTLHPSKGWSRLPWIKESQEASRKTKMSQVLVVNTSRNCPICPLSSNSTTDTPGIFLILECLQ